MNGRLSNHFPATLAGLCSRLAGAYRRPGTYHGVVIVSAGNISPVRAHFTVNWPEPA